MKHPCALLLALMLVPFGSAMAADDPYQWLENIDGPRSMEWIEAQNKVTLHDLAESPSFKAMDEHFLEILNSSARIPPVVKYGDFYYNFWRDAQHPRGIWRRTTLDEYRKAEPAWETVLDVDALAKDEGKNWFWGSADPLPADYTRCLISLSIGGADAKAVREFDLTTKSFVTDGFVLPESKSNAGWKDKDHLYVGMAFDSTTMTTSGYARVVKLWARGTPLSAATTVYEDDPSDVFAGVSHDFTPGFERDLAIHGKSFYSNEVFLLKDGKPVKIEKPDDAEMNLWKEWLLIQLRTDWTAGDKTYKAGSLLATKFDDFMAGQRNLDVLFEPTDLTSLDSYAMTKSAVLITTLDNVKSRLTIARPGDGKWTFAPMTGLPEFGTLSVRAVDESPGRGGNSSIYASDDYWLSYRDFLTPPSLFLGNATAGAPQPIKQQPALFDGLGSVVTQHEAVSKDGTKIPYFEIAPKVMPPGGNVPTLMTGYGGFEIPILPNYNPVDGSGWIARGGVFVVANIRGGGEFGPKWHQAAMRENRPRAYEDFAAVAEDLIKRGVTTPKHLGCIGGSNGGLLVGNMFIRRPDLWGAVVCESPLLDMHRYHLLLAGASWESEYGNPDVPADWAFIKTFSPYENVKKDAKYPPVLFTSSMRDDRVHPGHARKMVAKMEAQGHDVMYYENIEGGHGGAANNKEEAFQSALAFSFLWKKLGAGAGAAAPAAANKAAAAKRTGGSTVKSATRPTVGTVSPATAGSKPRQK
jgi:prolyl oligopeptidase